MICFVWCISSEHKCSLSLLDHLCVCVCVQVCVTVCVCVCVCMSVCCVCVCAGTKMFTGRGFSGTIHVHCSESFTAAVRDGL